MSHLPYSYIIGLEVHVELATQTKMFCRCLNQPFGAEPNTHVCPICTAMPGTLPVPNREAVRRTIVAGKALGSEINKLSKWDRKHYFYPDSPKGYQISQYDLPLCVGGRLTLLGPDGTPEATINFDRIHLEEDAGKLLHGSRPGYSQVDLNRAGVPLMEMVTKPDLRSPEQARRFMQEIRLLMRTLGISEADMEKGQMRCDVNVTITFEHEGKTWFTPITEIKNVNSTRAVERSLVVEAQRQYDEWMADGPIRTRTGKLTAGWDEDSGTVRINRTKEAAQDYRYFPEPDIPPLAVYEIPELNPENVSLPELPNARRGRYLVLGLSMADIELLLADAQKLERFERLLAKGEPAGRAANWLINAAESMQLAEEHLQELSRMVAEGSVGFAAAKQALPEIIAQLSSGAKTSIREVVDGLGLLQRHDEGVVQLAIDETIKENPEAVQQFKDGKVQIIGFLVGQVLKKAAGRAQPAKVQEALRKALS